jgi:hypothetical protein
LASPSWRSIPQHGPPGTAAVVEEGSTVVEVSAVAVSTAVAFVVAAFVADTLEAESADAEVESALVERASPVAFRTLPAEDPASLHLGILHLGSLSIIDELADP